MSFVNENITTHVRCRARIYLDEMLSLGLLHTTWEKKRGFGGMVNILQ